MEKGRGHSIASGGLAPEVPHFLNPNDIHNSDSRFNASVSGAFVYYGTDDSGCDGGFRAASSLIEVHGNVIKVPSFCDVHVHFREPGNSAKETIVTGAAAAARGGYTCVCTMPNLNPVPDSLEHLQAQTDLIDDYARGQKADGRGAIEILPYGAITVGELGAELADLNALAPHVVAFSDDGRGVQDAGMMREGMMQARHLNKMIVAHCEDNSLLRAGYIHDGDYAREHGHRGICSESEWGPIARDCRLVEETGCAYHVCHVSSAESVQVIREAKARGVNVTAETAPHYLLLDDSCLQEDGRFKMNPPLRSARDREALVEGIIDGTIDMIATDHAPHTDEEKSRGLKSSPFGVVGLEVAFPVLYTGLVKTGIISLEKLIDLLAIAPRCRFGLPLREDDYCVWDLSSSYVVDPTEFVSMGHATPFEGTTVFGRCLKTVCRGEIVYEL